jgi:hypothetical protein
VNRTVRGEPSHNHSPNYVVKDLNVCKKYGFMHTNIVNKHFSKSDKIQDFHMIVDDDPVIMVNNDVVLVNNTKSNNFLNRITKNPNIF